MQEARFAGACQDQHAGRPAPSLGWPGERKSIGATSRQASFLKNLLVGERKSVGATSLGGAGASRGLGPGPPGAWGPGHHTAWAWTCEKPRHQKRAQASG